MHNKDDHEEEEPINDAWIRAFEENDKLYNDFYKDDIWHVKLHILYINRDNEIDCMRQETVLMAQPNRILEGELIQILKRCSVYNGRRYSLISLLRYNILLEPRDVQHYLTATDGHQQRDLTVITNIADIVFARTIAMLHDLNALVIVLYEKQSNMTNPSASNHGSSTKRVFLSRQGGLLRRKKTLRKKV